MSERATSLKKALQIERQAELDHYTSLINSQGIQERIKEGITLYPIEYRDRHYTPFDELVLEFLVNPGQDPYRFSSNGSVSLFSSNSEEKYEGIVVRFKNNILKIQLNVPEIPEWIKSGKIGMNAIPDTKTYDVQLDILQQIENEAIPLYNSFYGTSNKDEFAIPSIPFEGLNPSQALGARHLVSANPFHIIHGPPGTGKTRTLAEAIDHLTQQGKRVLVAAPSNAAVDHITASLALRNNAILRMGNSFKTKEDILHLTLKQVTLNDPLMDVVKRLKKEAETVRKKAFKYKRNFGKEEYQERQQLRNELREIRKDIRRIEHDISAAHIEKAQIITGTFIGLQDKRLNKVEFDALFVDEAGQATEPLIWSIAHFAPKLFLAGDPLQLPPMLFTKEAEKLGLGISLIEAGMQMSDKGQLIPGTLLDTQYRMHTKIMQFSNAQFYNNQLKADASVADSTLSQAIHSPIEFIDTAGCGYDEKNDEPGGISNPGEADVVLKRMAEFQLKDETIGIISPYRQQVNLLQEKMEDLAANCQTIDSFQGQEREIIVLSLVRSNDSGTIGFLKDYRRMNVAMTRAKKKLVIIGDSGTIGNDAFYQELLEYVEKEGSYRSAWEFLT